MKPQTTVAVNVTIPVMALVGKQELSMDEAVNRLAEIQAQERALKKEKDAIRKPTEQALRDNKLDGYTTPDGHSVKLFTQVRYNPDKKYLESILTEDQHLQAFPPSIVKGMKVTA